MQFFRLLYVHREIALLALTTAVSLILFFNHDSGNLNQAQAITGDVIRLTMTPQRWYKDLLAVKKENQVLAEQVTQLRLLNTKLLRYQDENDRLRQMLQFTEEAPLDLMPGRVVNQNLSASIKAVIIDMGQSHSLVPNQCVMDMNGLLGKTISVGEQATKVQLISDKNFRVSVRVGKQRLLGIFVPTGGEKGEIKNIQKSAVIPEGALVVTSGISEIYPQDIPVARVVTTDEPDAEAFLKVEVDILADVNDLEYVFVVLK